MAVIDIGVNIFKQYAIAYLCKVYNATSTQKYFLMYLIVE